jgi:hypothetical protein
VLSIKVASETALRCPGRTALLIHPLIFGECETTVESAFLEAVIIRLGNYLVVKKLNQLEISPAPRSNLKENCDKN